MPTTETNATLKTTTTTLVDETTTTTIADLTTTTMSLGTTTTSLTTTTTLSKELPIKTRQFSYNSNGLSINALMCYPNVKGKYPIIMLNHGGVTGIGSGMAEYCERLAKRGFVVFASSYRGEDDSEGEIELAKGEVDDVLNLLELAKRYDFVDKERIGMVGFSHGGIITMLACERSNEIDAAVEHFAPYDIQNIAIPLQLKSLAAGWTEEDYKIRSPKTNIANLNCPLYIMHGDADNIVPVGEANAIRDGLKRLNKEHKVKIFKNAGHNFERDARFKNEEFEETLAWLNSYLR